MVRLKICLLGPYEVRLEGEPVTGFPSAKVRALLAYLAVEADRPHRRETLAGLLWPDYPERSARTSLSNALSHLRTVLRDRDVPAPCLLVERETVQFNPRADCWVDVIAFVETSQVAPAGRHLTGLEEGVALYRGPFLEGFSLRDSPPFEQWVLATRERLQRQAMEALGRLSATYEGRGDLGRACAHARRQLEIEPAQEQAHCTLMRLLARGGDRSAALAQYEACVRALREEVGVAPSAETVALYERIRSEDLTRFPKRVRSIPDQAVPSSNLPTWLTPFVGREELLVEIGARLRDLACRLLTLVGPGGSGKTRLAVEAAAREAAQYAHGVFFVSLAPLQSAESIVPAVAQAIGFSFTPGTDPRQQLLDYLRPKRVLLVLDNYEHLSAGVDVVLDILRAAPAAQALVTSRATLNVQGEHLLPVPGMDYPEQPFVAPEEAERYSAVQLFLQSARRVRPGWEPTAEELAQVVGICRLVQGTPLALLLAAAWADLLSAGEIAARIEQQSLEFLQAEWPDAPERQRSMRAAFEHSWRLLGEQERRVFAALSVFRGGFDEQAAGQVAGASLRDLKSLADRSLLHRAVSGRYEVHELLRQYGEEQLARTPEEERVVRDRHAAHYARLLHSQELMEAAAMPGEPRSVVDNARAGCHWAINSGNATQLRTLLFGLLRVYETLMQTDEARPLCQEVMGALRTGEPVGDRGVALAVALMGYARSSYLASWSVEPEFFRESQAMLRQLGAQEELAWCNIWAAWPAIPLDGTEAKFLEEALEIGTRLGRPELVWRALVIQAVDAMYRGAYEEAERCAQSALHASREDGHLQGVTWSLIYLGNALYMESDYASARQCYQESLAIAEKIGDQLALTGLPNDLGDVALAMEEHQQARKHYGEALAQSRGTTSRQLAIQGARAWGGLGSVALASGDEATARSYYQRALQWATENEDGSMCAGALIGPAALLAQRGSTERAVEVLALVLGADPYPITAQATAYKLLRALQAKLPPALFVAAEARGRARDLWATAQELLKELG